MPRNFGRNVFIGIVMIVAFYLIALISGPFITGYADWLHSWYDPDKVYMEVYEEKTIEEGKSPLAANTDAGCSAAFPLLFGVAVIFFGFEGLGLWLVYRGADWAWKEIQSM